MSSSRTSPSKSKEKYAVGFTMQMAIDVTQKEIDQQRASFDDEYKDDSIFDITITKGSSDSEIAKFIALSNHTIAEPLDVEIEEVSKY